MTDALKMTDMQQRANIEYERQRHLANWLIESSPHMPKPTAAQQKQLQQHQQQLQQQQLQQLACGGALTGKQAKAAAAKLKQSPMFLLAKIGHNMNLAVGGGGGGGGGGGTVGTAAGGGNSLVASSTFNSQTNLPLQILTSAGGRDGNKPKLRRFNSHDTSANMFSVAEFENARLARRNELENAALLRQRAARYKLNSLSSGAGGGTGGGDCSTGESKGSKLSSSESTTEPLFAEQFLERFSLPRVIRLSYTSSDQVTGHPQGDQTMTSSSSAESSSTAERPNGGGSGGSKAAKTKKSKGSSTVGGDLFLLYRYMRGYRSYHVFNTKAGTSRKKGYKIPHDFPGYFSFINDKGAPTATVYTTIVQLVRDQVYKFLSLDNLSAYTESHDNFSHKAHYVKATAKAGQVYRLLAVFQDGDHKSSASSPASHKDGSIGGAGTGNVGGREKERGKYAQLLDDNRQIYYVSLSAKGKFYEIEQHSAPVLQKHTNFGNHHQLHSFNGNNTSSSSTGTNGNQPSQQQHHQQQQNRKPKQLSRDCVHRIGFIMQSDPCLPLNLKLISPQTGGHSSTVPEYVTIAKISEENFLIACPLDEQQLTTTLTLTKLHLTPQMKFAKCTMGFENEQHMFLNANVQTVLKFCQFNCDNFLRVVDHETNAIELQQMTAHQALTMTSTTTTTGPSSLGSSGSGGGGGGGKHESKGADVLRRFGRLFGGGSGGGHDRNGSGHEKEDSIIFLSKNDLESLECGGGGRDLGGMDGAGDHHHHSLHHHHHHHHHSLVDDRTLGGRSDGGAPNVEPLSLPVPGSGFRSEKMKVFASPSGGKTKNASTAAATPSGSRWFRGFGGGAGTRSSANESVSADDEWDKRTSLDRYRDMSKLIQERFGTLGMLSLSSRAASTDRISGGAFDDGTIVSHDPSTSLAGSGREKCLSLQHIEQKSKPDLVPADNGGNDGDDDDGQCSERTGSELGDTIFFPLRHSTNQQSFMTQKLYSEFHVKTKQYSKSSSSIQQLLHLQPPGGGGGGGKKSALKNRFRSGGSNNHDRNHEVVLSFEDLRYMNRNDGEDGDDDDGGAVEVRPKEQRRPVKVVSLREPSPAPMAERTILDDLPYSSVRDSIVLQPDSDADSSSSAVPAESIYAEICADLPTPPPPPPPSTTNVLPMLPPKTTKAAIVHQHQLPEKRFVSIRINVPPCDSVATGGPTVSLNPAGASSTSSSTSRCSSAVSSPIEDNIYNTIK